MQRLVSRAARHITRAQRMYATAERSFLTVQKAYYSAAAVRASAVSFVSHYTREATLTYRPMYYFAGALPAHTKVAMPSLSPTMEKGTIQKWNFKEGDAVKVGDVLCEVETDKSTVGFEVQEDFILAKILKAEGSKDIKIGELVAIAVAKKGDVAAFANYDPATSEKPAAAPAAAAPAAAQPAASKPAQTISVRHTRLTMPSLSPTMEQGNIQKWNFKEGDAIKVGDVLCEVETDKSTVGFEVQEDFILGKILKPEGTKGIKIGELVAIAVYKKDDVQAVKDFTESTPSSAPAEQPIPVEKSAPAAQAAPQATSSASTSQPQDRVFASPLARKTASEKGIDLAQVGEGSGPKGRILKQDVEEFKPRAAAAATTAAAPAAGKDGAKAAAPAPVFTPAENPFYDTPLSNMRRVIATRLLESKTTIPHFYLSIDVNVDNLLEVRKQINDGLNIKVSVNDFVIKACAQALIDVPTVNSYFMNDKTRTFKNADISIAVATDGGLITPIVFEANKKTVSQISNDVKNLADKARKGKLQPKEFQGGTFSISNLGMFGIDHFCAVINPPQACILAVSRSQKKIIIDESNKAQPWKTANIMNVTLSCDHRIVDGVIGAQWLQRFKLYTETPSLLLA